MTDRLASLREEYTRAGLTEADLAPDPIAMFRRWFAEAAAAGSHEPNAMVLATVSADGRPSARMVLLKGLDERGFVFFTNRASRKGHELARQPALLAALPLAPARAPGPGRRACAELLDRDDVAAYFATRPRGSQLGAWASHQSRVVAVRAELDDGVRRR